MAVLTDNVEAGEGEEYEETETEQQGQIRLQVKVRYCKSQAGSTSGTSLRTMREYDRLLVTNKPTFESAARGNPGKGTVQCDQ